MYRTPCVHAPLHYPTFAPGLTSCGYNASTRQLTVVGERFFPASYGTTVLQLNGTLTLPLTIYSAYNASCRIPRTVLAGTYSVCIVNVYNNNLAPRTPACQPGVLTYSPACVVSITSS